MTARIARRFSPGGENHLARVAGRENLTSAMCRVVSSAAFRSSGALLALLRRHRLAIAH